jgi:hypothetical protein
VLSSSSMVLQGALGLLVVGRSVPPVGAVEGSVLGVLSRAPPYGLLASEGGISATKMRCQAGLNPGPWLWYHVGRPPRPFYIT